MQMLFLLLLFIFGGYSTGTQTDPTRCWMCKEIIGFTLTNPQFGNNTEWLLDKFCVLLPERQQQACISVVHNIARIFELIEDGLRREADDPHALCCMLNECSNKCCLSNLPEQIHLSYIGDPHTQIGVVWTTLENVPSVVQYGTNPNQLQQSQSGTVSTFTNGGWIGWVHKVRINDLKAGTRYYYRVGDGSSTWSPVFNFRTEPDNVDRTIRIATIGDMGNVNSAGNMRQLQKLVANEVVDFVLHDGDISYADGDQHKWDVYMRAIQNFSAYAPYMVTPGNHEIGVIGLLGLGLGYINRFILPGDHSISEDLENLYYSFNYGNIHFIALDTESRADIALLTKQQAAWVKADLAAVDRKVTPWIIVLGHRPFYCSNNDLDCGTEADVLKHAVEEAFNTYKVDLVLTGHKHGYERLWPIKRGGIPVKTYTNPEAPVYIVNGAGGNREGLSRIPTLANNSVTYFRTFGYGVITSYNSSVLEWGFYDSEQGTLLDQFVLRVNH